MEKGLFAPRVGRDLPWRRRRWSCAAASASRTTRTRSPGRCAPTIPSCSTSSSMRRTRSPRPAGWPTACRRSRMPISETGSSRFRRTSAPFTMPDEFNRGYIKSWNAAVQKELTWGFVGEAAYVATRQIDQLGFLELNWSPIGGGQPGRQLNRSSDATAQTRIVAPIGDTKYDALQARLDRRFANGVQLGVSYTLSKSTGIAGAPRQRRRTAHHDSRVLPLEHGAQPVRPHAQPADHQSHRASVRSRPALAERRRRSSRRSSAAGRSTTS